MTKFERAELDRMYQRKQKDKEIYWSWQNFKNRIKNDSIWIIHPGLFFHLECPYCGYKYDPEEVFNRIYTECPDCHNNMKRERG